MNPLAEHPLVVFGRGGSVLQTTLWLLGKGNERPRERQENTYSSFHRVKIRIFELFSIYVGAVLTDIDD